MIRMMRALQVRNLSADLSGVGIVDAAIPEPKPDEVLIRIEAAALRSDRFRQEREGDWKRLEAIVTRMEAGRWRRLSDADVLALPVLYRTVASSLSVARETSLDSATLAYLEALVQRAWFLVYGPRTTLAGWLARFLGGEWSRAVRAIWPELLVAFAVMAAGTLVGWLLVSSDPDWYYALVPGQFQDARVPGATRDSPALRDLLLTSIACSASAGSKTQPGGYAVAPESLAQFSIDDERSPAEIAAMLRRSGIQPVWQDWHPLLGRSSV